MNSNLFKGIILLLCFNYNISYSQHVHFDDYQSIYKKRYVGERTHILYIGEVIIMMN